MPNVAAAPKKEAPVVKLVQMDDERKVEFVGKRKMLKETLINTETGQVQVRVDFVNGETRLFTLPTTLMAQFAGHGAEQKLGDEVAGITEVDDMVMAVDNLMDRLATGVWSAKREASGMAGTSVLAKALSEHSGKPIEVIRAFLTSKSQAEKVALRANASIKPIVERLEAERAAKAGGKKEAIDTDGLLGELA